MLRPLFLLEYLCSLPKTGHRCLVYRWSGTSTEYMLIFLKFRNKNINFTKCTYFSTQQELYGARFPTSSMYLKITRRSPCLQLAFLKSSLSHGSFIKTIMNISFGFSIHVTTTASILTTSIYCCCFYSLWTAVIKLSRIKKHWIPPYHC